MNKTRIDWATHSWNPVTGCLGPNNDGATCSFCYARRIAERFAGTPAFPNGFAPTFHEDRLRDPDLQRIPAGSRVFVGSMTDLGAPWAAEYLPRILEAVATRPDVSFIFLTKQPLGFARVAWPGWSDNCWVGVTVTGLTQNLFGEPTDVFSCSAMQMAGVRFVSIEPILGPYALSESPDSLMTRFSRYIGWLIVGAQTGPGAVSPEKAWISRLLARARMSRVPVFMKSNLRPYWDGEWRQEYPR